MSDVPFSGPEKRSKKTDRRDANASGELLWVNRQRLLAGKKVHGIRCVQLPSQADAEDRQITAWRKRLGQLRTRTINKIKHILRKYNLEQECPTKGLDTIKGKNWLVQLALGPIERFPRPASLANYWGLTPGCRNSGDATDRLGSITKQGSAMARLGLEFTLRGPGRPRTNPENQ